MEKEMDSFEILEERINHLIAAYDSLKADSDILREQLKEKESALRALEEKVSRMGHEREAVKEKVESLLGRLDRLILSNR